MTWLDAHFDVLRKMQKEGMVIGLNISNQKIGCAHGKNHKQYSFSINRKWKKVEHPWQFHHTYICGPMSVDSIWGPLCFVLFKDDYKR